MAGRFNTNSCTSELEEDASTSETAHESHPSTVISDMKIASSSSPKRRRAIEKRVVAIPLKEAEGSSRLKGESPPPSDSWSWRKYGQKPIKGSPHPRGYYRCSSSKGCPARKQVERSRLDPTVLIITYSSDHNHPPKNKNHNHNQSSTKTATPENPETSPEIGPSEIPKKLLDCDQPVEPETLNGLHNQESLIDIGEHYSWFNEINAAQSGMLESPVFTERRHTVGNTGDVGALMPMREDDESLFADLEELPECSAVFSRGLEEKEQCHCTEAAPPWCGTTS